MKIPAILALLILPLLSRAGALDDYCQAQFAAGQHNAAAVHAALVDKSVSIATNPVARSEGLVADELALQELILTGAAPLVTTNLWAATALPDRAALVDKRLDAKVLAANTDAKAVAALVLAAKINALEERILRRGYIPYGPLAGQATEPVVIVTRGQAQWRVLGLLRAPTPAEVRAALKPAP